jgi:predicted phosphohydrolase
MSRKIEMEISTLPAKPLKIAVVTDVHIGAALPRPCTRLPERARSLLKYVVSRINTEMRPDFVVQLGNLIEAEDAETDEENYSTGLEVLSELQMPCYHVVGNHEQMHLSLKQLASMVNYPKFYYSFDSGTFHFVVLFGQSSDGEAVVFDDAQKKWLEGDLAAAEKPVVVFTHLPLHQDDDEQQRIIRGILAASGKVRAVINGHLHKNELVDIAGICYVSIQSLVQNISETRLDAAEAFAVITLGQSDVRIEVEGMDRAEFQF